MLFNSYTFLFAFLPITLLGYFVISRRAGRSAAIFWLVLASLFYYGWWNPIYLALIIGSLCGNFLLGRTIVRQSASAQIRVALLVLGVGLNLGLLAYFKYANFLVDTAATLTGSNMHLAPVVLPLAISFFTFQQIAFLVDCHRGMAQEFGFANYALFVTFFPQLIAGPIVHHAEMMPQFARDSVMKPRLRNFAIGLTIFAIGLFKKVVIADGVAAYATPVFNAANAGETLTLFVAWGGALSYTMQLYFDFSGYSDMAMGAARLFGIRLPINFFSPYKAKSIVEFWRRWHITLSRFLRDYLYIPLGGNRHGRARRYANLMTTMLLGGLWHGAGWTFVVWGALHGLYLVANHGWRRLCTQTGLSRFRATRLWSLCAWSLTFLAVVVGWVFFRAESFKASFAMLRGMAGLNGVALPNAVRARLGDSLSEFLDAIGVTVFSGGGSEFVATFLWLAALLPIVLVAPNSIQLLRAYDPAITTFSLRPVAAIKPLGRLIANARWRPTPLWSGYAAALFGFGVLGLLSVSEFLYFQF